MSLTTEFQVAELKLALTRVVFAIGDYDKDGEVTYEEAVRANSDGTKESFQENDTDGSGGLSFDELEGAIERRGAFDDLVSRIDANGDQVIDKEEAETFYDAMAAADNAKDFKQLKEILTQ